MYRHSPLRSITNSSMDHQALLKTTQIAILTTRGNCWNDRVSILSPFFQGSCISARKMLILKVNFKSSGFLPMKIGEVARKAGVRTSAIRFYEKAGVLPPAFRQNGQRRFAADVELQLAVIEFARKAGFTIAEIKLLFHGFRKSAPASARWRQLARKKYREMDLLITRLKSMQKLLKKSMRCHCTKLDDCGRILLSQSENAS